MLYLANMSTKQTLMSILSGFQHESVVNVADAVVWALGFLETFFQTERRWQMFSKTKWETT